MKIVTVNVPETYVNAIQKLVGENGLYPSRSELIRCAVREFLLKQLKLAQNMTKYNEEQLEIENNPNLIRVPIESLKDDGNGGKEKVREYKTFKIIQRLE